MERADSLSWLERVFLGKERTKAMADAQREMDEAVANATRVLKDPDVVKEQLKVIVADVEKKAETALTTSTTPPPPAEHTDDGANQE